jgi:hypothetical protein
MVRTVNLQIIDELLINCNSWGWQKITFATILRHFTCTVKDNGPISALSHTIGDLNMAWNKHFNIRTYDASLLYLAPSRCELLDIEPREETRKGNLSGTRRTATEKREPRLEELIAQLVAQ